MIKASDLDKIWVTADHHFGHENIIKYCNRPFDSIAQMDIHLIENWNRVIRPDDTVFHLGDFTLGDFNIAYECLSHLQGNINILANPWHHDKRWLPKNYLGPLAIEYPDYPSAIKHVNIVAPMIVLEVEGLQERPLAITLCHYPLEIWDRKHYGAWHLYGHTHKPDATGEYRLNVGVDCMNYHPISLGGVLEMMYGSGW